MKKNINYLVILLLLCCFTSVAQVAIVGSTNITLPGSSTTYTYNLPSGGGSQRLLVFLVSAEYNNTTNNVSSITYGSVSMSLVESTGINGSGKRNIVGIYRLNESQLNTVANNSVVITTSGTYNGPPNESMTVSMFLLGNVDQTTPTDGSASASSASANNISTSNINADTDDLIMYVTNSSGSGTTWTAGTAFTEQYDVSAGNHSYQIATQLRTNNGASSPAATNSSSNRLAISAVEINVGSSPLPIELLEFDGKITNDKVDLFWKSATESNNDYYTVFHSTDGIDWENIGNVKGAGTSKVQNKYSLIHTNPRIGNNYYLLQQTDFDGTQKSFDIISVNKKSNFNIKVYPNPSSNNIFVETKGNKIDVILYDMKGKAVKKYLSITQEVFEMNTTGLEEGTYYMEIANDQGVVRQKIVLTKNR